MDKSSNYEAFKKLLNRTSKVLFCYDIATASFSHLSTAFSYVWNRKKEDVIANPASLLDTVHPDDRGFLIKEYHELLNGNIKYDLEFRILLPDDTVLWLLLTPQLITDDAGNKLITGIVEDITVVKDNIRDLQKFAAKKNSVLEILSHELAGPLANIQSLADALSETTEDYRNAEVNNFIRIIRESSEKSIRMIREFVQQEFLESVHAGLVKRRVNLVEKVTEMVEQYKDGADLIMKEFSFSYSTDKVYVYIDQNKFMQALNNLVSNSIKFTHDGGKISIDLSEQEGTVLITVKDNGIGIPKRYHDELFEKFTPARRQGLRGEPSTGLGMSIIKTIVEWHNGTILFESEENVGTTFYIRIPTE